MQSMVLEQISSATSGGDPCSQKSQLQHFPVPPKPCQVHRVHSLPPKKTKGYTFLSELWAYSVAEGAGSSISEDGEKLGVE